MGRRRRPRARRSTSSPARSPSASRARRSCATPRCTTGPTASCRPPTARSTCSTSRSAGVEYRESDHEDPGDEAVLTDDRRRRRDRADRLLRPALPRALPAAGRRRRARSSPSPPRSPSPTTRDHWEPLIRARAIENQAFVVAANQIGEHPPSHRSGGRSLIVDPWGIVLAAAPDRERVITADLDLEAQADIRRRLPSLANRRPTAYRRAAAVAAPDGRRARDRRRPTSAARSSTPRCACSRGAASTAAACRTSPTRRASPTGSSTTTSARRTRCSTRCSSSAGTSCSTSSARSTARTCAPREKLYAITSFIVDSYRHDPDLMKVIIVEVTRAANSFGHTHLEKIREAYVLIAAIVERAQADGHVQGHGDAARSPRWRSTARSSRS